MKTIALFAVLLASSVADAQGFDFVLWARPTIDGVRYYVYDVLTSTTTDWTNARLEVYLVRGSFCQHPLGSDMPANPVLFQYYPDLVWDTYATTPSGALPSFAEASITNHEFIASWFDTIDDGPLSNARIARLTFNEDAMGEIFGRNYERATAGIGVQFGPFSFGYGPWPLWPGASAFAYAGAPYTIAAGDALTLDASASSWYFKDNAREFLWDLDGDGVYETSGGASPTLEVPYPQLQALGLGVGGPYEIGLYIDAGASLFGRDTTTLTITPEPASALLLSLGGLLVLERRRRH